MTGIFWSGRSVNKTDGDALAENHREQTAYTPGNQAEESARVGAVPLQTAAAHEESWCATKLVHSPGSRRSAAGKASKARHWSITRRNGVQRSAEMLL
ncbi:hypothetical protein HPB50_008048 [Hyalomma asiaticum]|uniref:Uncharacterized protein n=1 Tax=Hyalomma asiaticum TaxID=266040 RepID=A0ACB7TGW5_HYAAI|nr:hypothetical protein HPB50_008048 [Hyalomma asiaticum]